jgi:glycosyltransferase involved in cell wall biosynthesis
MPPERYTAMRHAARREYETRYTAEKNGEMLERIYTEVLYGQVLYRQQSRQKP